MEIFLYAYLGLLLMIAIVVGAIWLMDHRCALDQRKCEANDEHESNAAPYTRYYE
ncbi:hypothetical protein VSR68_11335 [Paraburkholderia phymatum]|uniref:hypothetical protein n=1 Tax=Paraburkholderia phymatum TaxID=148447 RepID=UPI0031784D63